MATNEGIYGNLTGYQYVRLGQVISCASMESIALGYLNINRDKIKQLKESRREDAEGFVRDVIEEWARRNPCDQIQVRIIHLYSIITMVDLGWGSRERGPLSAEFVFNFMQFSVQIMPNNMLEPTRWRRPFGKPSIQHCIICTVK